MQSYLDSIGLDLSDALSAAPALLGYKIIYESPEGITSGYIVETEAYHSDDPASHSFPGLNKRNSSLFKQAGTVYVYFTYGLHFCVNIVTGELAMVRQCLIRAIEPVDGIELMMKRRRLHKLADLTNGPAKLTQAMDINRSVDGTNIIDGKLIWKKVLSQGNSSFSKNWYI